MTHIHELDLKVGKNQHDVEASAVGAVLGDIVEKTEAEEENVAWAARP